MKEPAVSLGEKTPILTWDCKYKLKPIKNSNLFKIGIKII
jgi:hypothetical protein